MTKVRKLRELSWDEWLVLARAMPLLPLLQVALRVVPFPTLLRWVQARPRGGAGRAKALSPERTAWLVEIAARYGLLQGPLRPACLARSLALCALLSRQGHAARLVIGADRSRQNFRAHAWVELDGKILGTARATGYSELVAFEGAAARRQTA